MSWFRKNKKADEQEKIKEWPRELYPEKMSAADKDVLIFAMEESRLYLNKISENTNRLSNKGFVLLGIAGGMLVFIVNMIVWFISFTQTIDATQSISQIAHEQWLLVIFIAFCSLCLLRACYILSKIIFPMDYYPLGSTPKNLLKEKVLKHSVSEVLVSQMKNYQQRIDENIEQNYILTDYIEKSIKWVIIYPVVAIFLWTIIYFIHHLFGCLYVP